MSVRRKYFLPNIVTGARGALAIVAAILLQSSIPYRSWVVLTVVFVAALTDAIDGPLARRFNAESVFGGYFDHVVDTILVGVLFYAGLNLMDRDVYVIFLCLQGVTVFIGIRQTLIKKKEVWPNLAGRISYGVFIGAICLGLLEQPLVAQEWVWCQVDIVVMVAVGFRTASLWQWLQSRELAESKSATGGSDVGKGSSQ